MEEWAPKDFDFKEFAKGFASIQAMPLCQGCLRGGGRDNCEMKACASGKRIPDCTECDQPIACKNLKPLQHMRTGALKAGLFVKTEKADRQELLKQWTARLKNDWPSCILLCNSSTKM